MPTYFLTLRESVLLSEQGPQGSIRIINIVLFHPVSYFSLIQKYP